MRAILALALILGFSISTIAQTPQPTQVSGHLMGESAQEYCDHNYRDLNLKYLKKVCKDPSKDFTVKEGPVTPMEAASASIAEHTGKRSSQAPPYDSGKSFFFKQGRLETVVVVFSSMLVSNSEIALEFVKQKYGEPRSIAPMQYQNGLGAVTTVLNAEWSPQPDGTRIALRESLPPESFPDLHQTTVTFTMEKEQEEKIINPL